MSFCDQEAATDSVFEHLKSAWDHETREVLGYVPRMIWPNEREDKSLATGGHDRAWGRAAIRALPTTKHTLGAKSERRFQSRGLLTVQVLTPVAQRGLTLPYALGKVLLNAFEGSKTDEGVWFRETSFRTVGPGPHYYNSVFTTEFVFEVTR